MKKTILFGLCVWLLAIGKVAADNTLSVANVTIPKGGQATMEIVCSFSTEFVGGQWDVELPDDGKVTPTMANGKPVAAFGFTGTDHSISSSQLKNTQEQLLPKYRFVFTSMSSTALPTSGTLMTIVLNADETATVGTVYNAKLSNIELGTSGSAKTNLDDILFTVTIAEPLAAVTLNETSTTAPTASAGAVNVTVNRTIKAGEWSTICLPFDMDEDQVKEAFGDDVELADFTSWSFEGTTDNVEKITIGFTDVTEIEKNHPYIIKVSSNITSFGAKNVTIVPPTGDDIPYVDRTCKKGKTNYTGSMYGYYAFGDIDDNEIFINGNKFWYNNGNQIKAFRATFSFGNIILNDVSSSSRIAMSFDGSETTGIKDSRCGSKTDGHYYNLSGQQVETPAKGLYINNGKKIIVK